VILLDADVLWIDLAVHTDKKYPDTRLALDAISAANLDAGVTAQAFLEVVGKRSYGTSAALIPALPGLVVARYRLQVIPDPVIEPGYAGCTFDEVIAQMAQKMSLGDAVQAVQIAKYAPPTSTLLTWNAKHFAKKLAIPVLTPTDWLAARGGTP